MPSTILRIILIYVAQFYSTQIDKIFEAGNNGLPHKFKFLFSQLCMYTKSRRFFYLCFNSFFLAKFHCWFMGFAIFDSCFCYNEWECVR